MTAEEDVRGIEALNDSSLVWVFSSDFEEDRGIEIEAVCDDVGAGDTVRVLERVGGREPLLERSSLLTVAAMEVVRVRADGEVLVVTGSDTVAGRDLVLGVDTVTMSEADAVGVTPVPVTSLEEVSDTVDVVVGVPPVAVFSSETLVVAVAVSVGGNDREAGIEAESVAETDAVGDPPVTVL